MGDLTRYRIRNGDPCAAMANLGVTGELQHERSCFVEDSTLQAIADAWYHRRLGQLRILLDALEGDNDGT